MIEIQLTKGFSVRVDDIDKDLSLVSWYATSDGYAARSIKTNGKKKMVYLHRVILERKIGRPLLKTEIADHVNRDIGNSSRDNLRVADYSQSVHNTEKKHGALYKGISFRSRDNRWNSRIRFHDTTHHIGNFESPEEAARAYDFYAIKYHGEYACLNFPDDIKKTIEWFENYTPPAQHNGTNEFRGVWRNGNKWSARITINGNRKYLGTFDTSQEAHNAFADAYRNSK